VEISRAAGVPRFPHCVAKGSASLAPGGWDATHLKSQIEQGTSRNSRNLVMFG